MQKLTRFQIIGLYGHRTIDIEIKDNTIILVGENGMGKTTVLKFMVAILSGAFDQIPFHKFDKIVVTIEGTNHEIAYEDVGSNKMESTMKLLWTLPPVLRKELKYLEKDFGNIDLSDVIKVAKKNNYSLEKLVDRFSRDDQINLFENKERQLNSVPQLLNAKIIYLPTYRRIEEDLQNVIKGKYSFSRENIERKKNYTKYSELENNGYIELVEFGMQDVKEKIEKRCYELSQFSESHFKNLAYMSLGDVIDKNYISNKNENPITEDELNKFKLCLSRSTEEILSQKQVDKLIETVMNEDINTQDPHMQILLYYFRNLLVLQKELEEKEQSIIDFCDICNKYLSASEKKVRYDISTFKIQIFKQRKHTTDIIDMGDLSSGEKQIISLFSHLYLAESSNYFVIIDEPELSLSVPWQKIFIEDIKKSKFCSGIIAATHSPFIYDNTLFPFTHGLGEFIEEDK